MLRATARQELLDKLEFSFFGSSNFLVNFHDGAPIVFEIKFIPDRRFYFQLRRAPANSFEDFVCVESPGENFLTPQTARIDEVQIAFSRIDKWLERVREEVISTNPFAREIVALRKQVDERIASIESELDGFFTSAEAVALSSRLQELAAKLSELQEKNDKLEGDVSALSKAIEDLNSASTVVDKKTWYRMASGRLLGGLKSVVGAKETREFALEAAKKFLLEGPQ